jgi:hypothetical protein
MDHKEIKKGAIMQFILTGFTQDIGFRVFAFERMGLDRVRTKVVVRADLALIRRYGIQVQELPLLCRNLLERNDSGTEPQTLIFSEDEMSLHAKGCKAAKESAAQRRKPARRPPSENIGAAWRGHHPIQGAAAATAPSMSPAISPAFAGQTNLPDQGDES